MWATHMPNAFGQSFGCFIRVLNHPDKFTSLAENTEDFVQNERVSKRNGAADFGFMKAFRRRCL